MSDFNNSWLGFDLRFEEIENQPSVQTIRKMGIQKRVKMPEYHVTAAYFANVNLEELAESLRAAEAAYGKNFSETEFLFDGYGMIEQPQGKYFYFNPSPDSAPEAFFLESTLKKNQAELHMSIGGPDPFESPKTKQAPLKEPFRVKGRLVFVGNDGTQFQKFAWDSKSGAFVSAVREDAPQEKIARVPHAVHTIALFPKIQADTAAAVYLLQAFGEELFPGVAQAKLVFWSNIPEGKTAKDLEAEGYLLLDLGGPFDHHLVNERSGKRSECVSTLIAKHLGIFDHPALQKLLTWTKRDDLEGKGTISADSIDRAFGLSGIIMNLNREYHDNPAYALDVVTHLIGLHVREEYRRHVELPEEWESLLAQGKAETFVVQQGAAELDAVVIESDNVALAGYLKAAKKIDLIIQRRTTGHTNILTQQIRSLDLRPIIAELRLAETEKKGVRLSATKEQLQMGGRLDSVPEWYYDEAANTLQNGGVNPQGVSPTQLSRDEVVAIVRDAIPRGIIGSLKRKKQGNAG